MFGARPREAESVECGWVGAVCDVAPRSGRKGHHQQQAHSKDSKHLLLLLFRTVLATVESDNPLSASTYLPKVHLLRS